MCFRSLESRIVILFLALVLTVQLTAFFAIRRGIENNARTSVQEELAVGERMFQRLLTQHADRLTDGVRVLAKDHGFLSAVGAGDRATMSSALSNHRAHIGAALSVVIGQDHRIKAASAGDPSGSLGASIVRLVDKAERDGSTTGLSIVDGYPYQIAVLPVKTPFAVVWVGTAFPIDQRMVADMRLLSSLHVSIYTGSPDGVWMANASTLDMEDAKILATQLRGIPDDIPFVPRLHIGNDDFGAKIMKLPSDSGQAVTVVLQHSVSEALAPYRELQLTLLLLTAIGIAIVVVGSFFTARRIAGPLRQLAETAKRLGAGDYQTQIEIDRSDEIGDLSKAFESMRDGIATRELAIRRLAYWDTLTSLPNRAQFADLLSEAIQQAKNRHEACHILMMDLDRFKNVNDVLGHGFGDAVLRLVAERLKRQINEKTDHLARLGGDEFAILLPHASIAQAKTVAARILKSLEAPISLEEQTVDLGAGIGIAGFPEHGADAESLLSHVEVAMYAAKTSGNEAVIYDPAIDKSSQQSLSLLSELRRAIEQDEFRLYVQPKVMLDTGRVVGLEALVRWAHPEKGLIFPDNFVPFAEKTGFVRVLTCWVLDRAAALCGTLSKQNIHPKISINLSARDLLDQHLPAKFAEILERHKVDNSSFCLEITESAIMDDPLRAQQTLEGLHAMNVELAIDDFGTGYSSLAYLKRLPVDELKIDKSFVMKMERDIDDAKIVRSTIDLAHNMGLRVVAEGIENEVIWDILAQMGCDQGQGYFVSKPIPAEQFPGWLRTWMPPRCVAELDPYV